MTPNIWSFPRLPLIADQPGDWFSPPKWSRARPVGDKQRLLSPIDASSSRLLMQQMLRAYDRNVSMSNARAVGLVNDLSGVTHSVQIAPTPSFSVVF